jgi:hypothetical protein
MPDWLCESLHDGVAISTSVLFLRLGSAFVMGLVAAGVYRLTTRVRLGAGFLGTLVLLSVLICVLTLVIGNSAARAFTLVGALAIVRFRTIVEDTRDTAFVIFAVASGMACGAGYMAAPAACTPLVLAAAWVFRPGARPAKQPEQTLVLRLGPGKAIEEAVSALLKERVPARRLVGVATARGGAALDVTWTVPALPGEQALALVGELNRIEGVQGVEWKSEPEA